MLIRLTPSATRGSVWVWLVRTSRDSVSGALRGRSRVPRLPCGLPVAGRLSLPTLWAARGVRAAAPGALAVQGVGPPDVGHGGDGPASDEYAPRFLVLGGLLGGHAHGGPLGPPSPAAARDRPLRDGLGPAPQAPPSHGPPRPGPPDGGRSRWTRATSAGLSAVMQ